jgi:hypothetical protein
MKNSLIDRATVGSVHAAGAFPPRSSNTAALLCFTVFAVATLLGYAHALHRFAYWMLEAELTQEVTNRDFANYWMGARLVLAGEQQQLFTWESYFPRMQAVFGNDYPIHNWGYPPHALLMLWPLGYLEYRPALVLFLAASFAMFAASVVLFRREYAPRANPWLLGLALVGYVLLMVDATQNGFLSAAAILLGMTAMHRRPWLAGLAFAFLTIKPQLGILLPVLLAIDRNWRTVAWSVLFTGALVGASVICFGVQSWQAYLIDTLPYQRFVMTHWTGIFLQMMPTAFGSARALGLSAQLASYIQAPVSIGTAALVLWLLWREPQPLRRAFIVVCGTLLITPYALNYDMGALSVVAALLAISGSLHRRIEVFVVSAIAVIAGAVLSLGTALLPVTPLVLAAGLLVLANDRRSAQ